MDIVFQCASCGQKIAIDPSGAGKVVQCPKCGQNLIVPSPLVPTAKEITEGTPVDIHEGITGYQVQDQSFRKKLAIRQQRDERMFSGRDPSLRRGISKEAQDKLKRQSQIFVGIGLGMVFVSLVLAFLSRDKPKSESNRAIGEQTVGDSNVASIQTYRWNHLTQNAQKSLCDQIARKTGKDNAAAYYAAIDGFFRTTLLKKDYVWLGEPAPDQLMRLMKEATPSTMRQVDTIIAALEAGKISPHDVEIYNFYQQRWDFYQNRDGRYIPSSHDDLVTKDAMAKFGIEGTDADEIFDRVDKIRVGLR